MKKFLIAFLYLILIETFVELMIKSMDMEKLDWKEPTSWQIGKVVLMAALFFIQFYERWRPFIIVSQFKKGQKDIFVSPIRIKGAPWFFFACIAEAFILLLFGSVIYKLNPNAWQLYVLLYLFAAELIIYLLMGFRFKLFVIVMGKNSLIISKGILANVAFKNIRTIEKKYGDELYFVQKDGKVETINYRLLEPKALTEFLIKLKNNCDEHGVYLGNDVGKN